MTQEKLTYVELEVGGIQNYILSTGKLKEMIGGSEIIENLSKEFFKKICNELQLCIIEAVNASAPPKDKEILVLQANAGALHALFSSEEKAKEFVTAFGKKSLCKYPGLPLYAALCPCDWNNLSAAKKEVSKLISKQRALKPLDNGPVMQPVFKRSRIDGDTAVEIDHSNDGNEYVSLASAAKRQDSLIAAAQERLNRININKNALYWPQDLTELCASSYRSENRKIAFIHMDGNDLGILFRSALKQVEQDSPALKIQKLGLLSKIVSEASGHAFKDAASAVIDYITRSGDADFKDDRLIVPIRPLVLGGDDVTVVVRADLALLFIHVFIRSFEDYTETKSSEFAGEQGRKRLTMGVGMVVCNAKYPFLKAFERCEALIENAKKATVSQTDRKSSMDYLVITNEPEIDLKTLRRTSYTADDGARLTGKPFVFNTREFIPDFVEDAYKVLTKLPRSQIRGAMTNIRKGVSAAQRDFNNLEENLSNGIGGRSNKEQMKKEVFDSLFNEESFFKNRDKVPYTLLGDYLELAHLLPKLDDDRQYKIYKECMSIKTQEAKE